MLARASGPTQGAPTHSGVLKVDMSYPMHCLVPATLRRARHGDAEGQCNAAPLFHASDVPCVDALNEDYMRDPKGLAPPNRMTRRMQRATGCSRALCRISGRL